MKWVSPLIRFPFRSSQRPSPLPRSLSLSSLLPPRPDVHVVQMVIAAGGRASPSHCRVRAPQTPGAAAPVDDLGPRADGQSGPQAPVPERLGTRRDSVSNDKPSAARVRSPWNPCVSPQERFQVPPAFRLTPHTEARLLRRVTRERAVHFYSPSLSTATTCRGEVTLDTLF